jgi:methylated-DNA-[protein]-cysteine S-methyltransferase
MSRYPTCENNRLKTILKDEKSSFTRDVYTLVSKVPAGRVTTYKIVAKRLGTKSYRAVGNALNRNQHPDCIPCHRVVRSDTSIGGYAFGEEKKKRLLTSEGIMIGCGKVLDFKRKLFIFK